MHTFAQKPKATQQAAFAKSTMPGRGHFGQSPEVRSILDLQRANGNQAVQRMLQTDAGQPEVELTEPASPRFGHDFSQIPIHSPAAGAIQTKLAINKLGDSYEQEADHVAEQVMRTPEPQLQRACPCGGGCPKCRTEQPGREYENLQTKRVQASDTGQIAAPPIVHEVLRSPGQPLDPATRAFMEPRFGYDFSQVRVHYGATAERSARDVNANAYTVGRDIVFGAGRFAPGTHAGRRLLAHELTHVVQQGGSRAIAQRDTPDDESETVTVTGITVYEGDVGEGVGVGWTEARQTIRVKVEVNNLKPGQYDSDVTLGEPAANSWSRVHFGSFSANRFVYLLPPGTVPAREFRVIVRRNVRREVRALRGDVRQFLIDESRPAASDKSLERTADIGHKIQESGISEDELLLLRYNATGPKRPAEQVIDEYLEHREMEKIFAEGARERLIRPAKRLASLEEFAAFYALPPLGTLKNQFPRAQDIIDRNLSKETAFSGLQDLRDTLDDFADALDEELFGLGMTFLNEIEVGLIRMQDRYLGTPGVRRPSSAYLGRRLSELKANPKVAAALAAHRRAVEADADGDEIERLAARIDEAVNESSESGFTLRGGVGVSLLGAKNDDESQNKLADFVFEGRATIARMRQGLDASKPTTLYWDRLVAAQKERMGIERGTWMDSVVDEVIRVRRQGPGSSFWDKAWSVLQVVLMFVPGGLGFAIRTVLAASELQKSQADFNLARDAHKSRLSSNKPSLAAHTAQVAFTAGGIAIDAKFTRFIPKLGKASRVAEGTVDDIARAAGGKADDLTRAAKSTEGVADDAARAAVPGARIPEEATDKMTKAIYKVGGNVDHEYKVLANGRVVRCSKLCGDPDELLIEAYEDVLRANPHLIEELSDLTKLLRTNPDEGAKAAAEMERRLARLRGSEAGHGVRVRPEAEIGVGKEAGIGVREKLPGRAPTEPGIKGDIGEARHAAEVVGRPPVKASKHISNATQADLRAALLKGEISLDDLVKRFPPGGASQLFFPTSRAGGRFVDHAFVEAGGTVVFRESKNYGRFTLTEKTMTQIDKDLAFLSHPDFGKLRIEWRISNIDPSSQALLDKLVEKHRGRFTYILDKPW
jgi:hypothetical protein